MNGTQVVIAASFGGLVLVSLFVAVRVIRSTGARQRRLGVDTALLARRENKWAAAVLVALLVLLAATMFTTPYGETSDKGAQRVKVTAFQFGWKIEPSTVRTNKPVAFEINSRDVQHGFGIYQGAKLIEQVQVPAPQPGDNPASGPQQRLVHTFHEPGRYDVLCLEYCGLNHDKMRGTFTVRG
jgi:cytochrome c oxidase subunit 2